ncbi:MAG TPA: hypothetical protein VHQ65_03940, partial [Thermoanaerobaculia bacterium]|nr:hypothetical protein [Thermoanaerobaculia bacterium]
MSYFLGHRRTNRALWRRLPRMAGFVARLVVAQESLLFQPQRPRRATPADLALPWEPVRLGAIDGWWIAGEPRGP